MRLFKIFYEVDNGCAFIVDTALVYAENEENAKVILSEFICAKEYETQISKFISVEPFYGQIFTGEFGYR